MITAVLAGAMGLLNIWIARSIIKKRQANLISLGDGSDNELLPLTSAHDNFTHYTPIFLILLFFCEEKLSMPTLAVAVIAALFLAGRVFHCYGISNQGSGKRSFKKRIWGMYLTLPLLLIVSLYSLIYGLTTLLS